MVMSSEGSLKSRLTVGRNVILDLDFISSALKMQIVDSSKMLVAYSAVAVYARDAA
jgi:hypothetical protein